MRKLKSELALTIRNAMIKKGIYTYKELIKQCDIKKDINYRFLDVLVGKQKILEEDLMKISNVLEIPMSYFKKNMKREIKYYIEEYTPIDISDSDKLYNYSTINKKEYQRNYYSRVTKLKRKQQKK